MWITNENNIIRQPEGIRVGDVNHPASIFWCWSKEQLAEIGIKPYHPGVVPSGHRVIGAYNEEVDGEVYERFNTEPLPEPEPTPEPEPILEEVVNDSN
jgi:hypothetical protein